MRWRHCRRVRPVAHPRPAPVAPRRSGQPRERLAEKQRRLQVRRLRAAIRLGGRALRKPALHQAQHAEVRVNSAASGCAAGPRDSTAQPARHPSPPRRRRGRTCASSWRAGGSRVPSNTARTDSSAAFTGPSISTAQQRERLWPRGLRPAPSGGAAALRDGRSKGGECELKFAVVRKRLAIGGDSVVVPARIASAAPRACTACRGPTAATAPRRPYRLLRLAQRTTGPLRCTNTSPAAWRPMAHASSSRAPSPPAERAAIRPAVRNPQVFRRQGDRPRQKFRRILARPLKLNRTNTQPRSWHAAFSSPSQTSSARKTPGFPADRRWRAHARRVAGGGEHLRVEIWQTGRIADDFSSSRRASRSGLPASRRAPARYSAWIGRQ